MSFLEENLGQRLTNFKLIRMEISPEEDTYRLIFVVLPASTELISV